MKGWVYRANETIKPSRFLSYRKYLEALYLYLKSDVPQFSFRRFSEFLGFGQSTLIHQIVRGYRLLSQKNALKIAKRLELKDIERNYFLTLVRFENAKDQSKRDEHFEKILELKKRITSEPLDKNWLSYVSEWYHPVINELMALEDGRFDKKRICDVLIPSLRPEQVVKSLELLEHLGFIQHDHATGRYKKLKHRLETAPEVQGVGIVSYHKQMMDQGKEALSRVPAAERNMSAMTLTVDESTFLKIKILVQNLQSEIMTLAESSENPDRVIQLCFQLFPFTKKMGEKET